MHFYKRQKNLFFLGTLLLAVGIFLLIIFFNFVFSESIRQHYIIPYVNNISTFNTQLFIENTLRHLKRNFSDLSLINIHQNDSQSIRILLWTPLFDGMNFLPLDKNIFKTLGCLESRCDITGDRNELKNSDAVIFHVRTFAVFDIPHIRPVWQKWIFFTMEAPPYSSFPGLEFMYGMFNWTMSYRHDSDVVIPYGRIIKEPMPSLHHRNDVEKNVLWATKSKKAVWMVSHCDTHGTRESYVRELQNYFDVDIYGFCGAAVCPFNKTEPCMESFEKKYLFFLAFENAICDDYVTEKFFRALSYDMVVVVFGGADYASIAPQHSYINALDYASPYHLAVHLREVSKNATLYFEYLKWKENGYKIINKPDPCDVCAKLHFRRNENKIKTYSSMVEWWINKSHCKNWKH